MNKNREAKTKLRKEISVLKNGYSSEELKACSQEVWSIVEITGVFQEAKHIFIYHSMADEVETLEFIRKWSGEKNFYIPVVIDDNLVFRHYLPDTECNKSAIGVMEPSGADFKEYRKVGLVIVPGVAFDRKKNRLGRGKGYYDRFLTGLSVPKMGVCFDFQLLDSIPVDKDDIGMDYIVSENDLIW